MNTFERQAELLEQIHALARELSELAGDTIAITIQSADKFEERARRLAQADQLEARVAELEQQLTDSKTSPGVPSTAAPSARLADNGGGLGAGKGAPGEDPLAADVIRVLRDSGDWMPSRDIAAQLGKPREIVAQTCARLVRHGALEHNGRKTKAARVRLALNADPLPGGGFIERSARRAIRRPRRACRRVAALRSRDADRARDAHGHSAARPQDDRRRPRSDWPGREVRHPIPTTARRVRSGRVTANSKRKEGVGCSDRVTF